MLESSRRASIRLLACVSCILMSMEDVPVQTTCPDISKFLSRSNRRRKWIASTATVTRVGNCVLSALSSLQHIAGLAVESCSVEAVLAQRQYGLHGTSQEHPGGQHGQAHQCSKAMLPARESRSSSSLPTRT